MARLDDLIEELSEQGRQDDADELEKLRGSTLRKAASKAEGLEKEVADLKAQIAQRDLAPKRQKAFEDAGIDFEALSKAERKVLESFDGDPEDDDAISAFVEEYGFPTADPEAGEAPADEAPAAAQVAKAAKRSGEGRGGRAPKIKPEDVSGWSMEKRIGFANEHPDAWEQLKRGEAVTAVA